MLRPSRDRWGLALLALLAATGAGSLPGQATRENLTNTLPAFELVEAVSLVGGHYYESRYVICHVRRVRQRDALAFESTACLLEVTRGTPRVVDWFAEAIGPELHNPDVGKQDILTVTFVSGAHTHVLQLYAITETGLVRFNTQPPGSGVEMPELRGDLILVKNVDTHFKSNPTGVVGEERDGVDEFTEYYRIKGLDCILEKVVHEVTLDP